MPPPTSPKYGHAGLPAIKSIPATTIGQSVRLSQSASPRTSARKAGSKRAGAEGPTGA